MSDSVRDLLVRGIAAAKANQKDEARFYLEWVLRREDKDREQAVDALLWLSQLVDSPADKRACLEQILVLNPTHPLARRGMAILQGRLKPEDVVDHNKPVQPVQPAPAPAPANVRRYICPKCGGKMAFDAKRRALSCAYCGHQMWEYQAIASGALAPVEEHDFFATLPTAQAHRWELPTERVLACSGCGAAFALPPFQVSGACPYCESPYTVGTSEFSELIQPEGVLPFQFDDDAALQRALRWLKEQHFRPSDLDRKSATARPRGVYLPFWTFDIGGEVKWHAVIEEDRQVFQRSDLYLVLHDDLLIPASHSLPIDLLTQLADFDTQALVPYSTDLLADWAAQIYQLPMADASLVARQRVMEAAKQHIRDYILGDKNVRELTCSSLGVVVNTFKLVMLPVWVTSYHYEGKRHPLAVNGQTGKVAGNVPRSGFQKFLAWAFGDT
jgi:DNA-directed RNA polymerase subunit RPC12/RpoP